MLKHRLLNRAFTLIELMIVVVLIGIIAAYAIPNYTNTISNAYERDAVVNLRAIYAAEQIYKTQHNTFLTGNSGISEINSGLSLDIATTGSGATYACVSADGSAFTCTASKSGGFSVEVANTHSTPCCTTGNTSCKKTPAC